MSYAKLFLCGREQPVSDILQGAAAGEPTTFDEIVAQFDADLVSYWKFQVPSGTTVTDENGTQNATITGNPERSVETIVDLDRVSEGASADGTCIAWSGQIGEYAEAANNAAHKTNSGTIIVQHQHDTLSEKSILLAADANIAAGGLSVEVNTDGSSRAFLRDFTGLLQPLTGQVGDVQPNIAYTTIFKWGSPGISLALWGPEDNLIRRVTSAITDGVTGTSTIRFGAWHTDVGHHDGPYGRVVWLNRRISDIEEAQFARARTIDHSSPSIEADLPYLGQYYGCGHTPSFGAANTHMKSATDAGVSFFFRAEKTGSIDRINFQVRIGAPGTYSDGDLGIYTIQIRTANPATNLPIPLASGGEVISQLTGWQPVGSSSFYATLTFTSRPGLTLVNNPYCLVFRNTHGSPAGNYFSTNVAQMVNFASGGPDSGSAEPANYVEPSGANPENPGSSPTPISGWTPIYVSGEPWYNWPLKAYNGQFQYNRFGPEHCSLRYTDGQWVFFATFPASGASLNEIPIGGADMIRERFRVTRASRVVSGVFIRLARFNGTTGNLFVHLEQGPTGDAHFPSSSQSTPIESVPVPHTTIFNVGADWEHSANHGTIDPVPWIWVPFTTNRTLQLGTIYNLRLSADASLDVRMKGNGRVDDGNAGMGPAGSATATWATWEATRNIPWAAWEDSRGLQRSANSGTTWTYHDNRSILSPIVFKCV